MSLEIVTTYLQNSFPSISVQYVPALTELVNTLGLKETRKQIRAAHGICPQIVPLHSIEGVLRYAFKRATRTFSLDYNIFYTTADTYTLQNTYHYYHYEEHDGHRYYTTSPAVTALDYLGDSYTTHQWAHAGQECECGNIHINFRGGNTCPICAQANQPLSYSAKAEELLGFEDTKETLFGIELEYEQVTAIQVKHTLDGHAIAKHDGTISCGVEVVTRPACIKTHKEKLSAFYKAVKVQSAPNTGMHVHVAKKGLSNFQIGFMLEFMNKPTLLVELEKIAGRRFGSNHYCRPHAEHNMLWGNRFDEDEYKHTRTSTDKYSPLNTRKPTTIEFRIFSSPVSHLECNAKLDFVAALVRYSSPYAVSVKRLKDKFEWSAFIGFVSSNRKEFPDFNEYYLKAKA